MTRPPYGKTRENADERRGDDKVTRESKLGRKYVQKTQSVMGKKGAEGSAIEKDLNLTRMPSL